MSLGSKQPLTEMSTRNLPGGKEWPAREKASVRGRYISGYMVLAREGFVPSYSDIEMGDTRKKRQQTFRKSLLSFVKLKHTQTFRIINFILWYQPQCNSW
jgi:hypothetical protein